MSASHTCDVLVVGTGAAGCIAALRLARAGLDVIMVGRETSATELSTGRVDLTGVPDRDEIASLLVGLGASHGLYQATPRASRALTNHGTVLRQSLSSTHDWTITDLQEPVAVVGLKDNPDLEPLLVCSTLAGAETEPRLRPYRSGLSLPLSVSTGGRVPLADGAEVAIEQIAAIMRDLEEPTVVLPTFFTGPNYSLALGALERSTGRRLREAATPLSNPGRRLQSCLEDSCVRAGCTAWKGRSVHSIRFRGSQAVEVIVRSGLREQTLRPDAVLLATGNLVAGGLQVDGRGAIDALSSFAVEGGEGAGLRSMELGKALATGIRHADSQAVLKDGTVTKNVFVAGSSLPGMSYPLGRGLGHVISSAWAGAGQLREAMGS